MKSVALTIHAGRWRTLAPFVRTHIRGALKLLGSPLCELSIALVDDRTMSHLHKRFMNDSSTTDVLTFPLEFDRRRRVVGGEVVVCVSEARRRAAVLKLPARSEVLLYALHGLLHLCGYDDRTPADYRRMHEMEDAILTRLGVGRVFSPPSPAARRKGMRQ